RWGPKVEDLGYKTKYRAYLSEQVLDGSKPDTLILAHIDVLKPHVASCEAVSNWQERSQAPHVRIVKTIYHPGEVNKVREIPQHPEVVVTHTDSPQLYVWNMDQQPNRRPQSAGLAAAASSSSSSSDAPSRPDLVLVGHEDDAPFPLACSAAQPRVGSGGNDQLVLVWDLNDHVSSTLAGRGGGGGEGTSGRKATELKRGSLTPPSSSNPTPSLLLLGPPFPPPARWRLEGHTATVGDLVFQPGGSQVLVSVADDGRILTWDLRTGAGGGRGGGGGGDGGATACVLGFVGELADAHGVGVNVMCVDWCPLDENLLVTGECDHLYHFHAHRTTPASPGHHHHHQQQQSEVIHVEWHPTCKDVFASGSEDHTIAIWDLSPSRVEAEVNKAKAAAALIFRHLGHRSGRVTDFQWLPSEPWTLISVSDNSDDDHNDGTLQVWRIMDLIYRPYEEALAELDQHR
ncbi:hypothetical protein VOLCADRAFT_30886, partial [Volvox carteri f. nagariensis]